MRIAWVFLFGWRSLCYKGRALRAARQLAAIPNAIDFSCVLVFQFLELGHIPFCEFSYL